MCGPLIQFAKASIPGFIHLYLFNPIDETRDSREALCGRTSVKSSSCSNEKRAKQTLKPRNNV